jgi:DNA repair exonuclease SbcCD nuclease subunit
MIFGHISDTHLGACIRTRKEREDDYYNTFREAIELFIKEHVNLVIHSGDILDEPRPYGTAIKVLVQEVMKLKKHNIPFLFTLGEHDISNVPSTPHPIILELQDIGRYIGDGTPTEVNGVTIVGIYKHKRIEHTKLIEKLEKLSKQLLNIKGKKILVLHQGIKEIGGIGGELSILEIPPRFDYYAMGHLHVTYKKSLATGLLVYPGATHWVDVNDPSECGVFLVDISGDEPTAEWVKLNTVRPKLELEVNIKELDAKIAELNNMNWIISPCIWLDIVSEHPLDVQEIQNIERKLKAKFLTERIRTIITREETKTYTNFEEASLEEELRNLAIKVLKDEKLVDFALKELLPLLRQGDIAEAKELTWKFFKEAFMR